jgi:DNA modification methylase
MLGIVTHPLDRWVQAIMVKYDGIVSKAYSGHLKLNDIGRSGKTSKVPGNYYRGRGKISGCLKPKDLMMIPNRVAIALQDAGWYIRSEIIWHKPNPMPESVTDRPTSCHEKIWLITKNKKYYYDADIIKEPCKTFDKNIRDRDTTKLNNTPGRTKMAGLKKNNYIMKNKRNVWTVTTKPCREAHFATFPKDLIEPCIKAGCPENGTVLDPFGGSGTTGIVAALNNRNAVLIELNQDYIDIANKRIDKELGLFKQTNKGGK